MTIKLIAIDLDDTLLDNRQQLSPRTLAVLQQAMRNGVAVTIGFTAIGTFILLMIVKYTIGLRVGDEAEVEGLDMSQHGEALHG